MAKKKIDWPTESHERLYKAIKKHGPLDDKQIKDAAEHGADAGWAGFTYYTDTVKFYDKNAKDIWELLNEDAEQMGEENVLTLISKFRIAGTVEGQDTLANMLAWYALETIGNELIGRRHHPDDRTRQRHQVGIRTSKGHQDDQGTRDRSRRAVHPVGRSVGEYLTMANLPWTWIDTAAVVVAIGIAIVMVRMAVRHFFKK